MIVSSVEHISVLLCGESVSAGVRLGCTPPTHPRAHGMAGALPRNLVLSNGVELPAVGLGTFKASPADVKVAVHAALQAGIRAIDTAAIYKVRMAARLYQSSPSNRRTWKDHATDGKPDACT